MASGCQRAAPVKTAGEPLKVARMAETASLCGNWASLTAEWKTEMTEKATGKAGRCWVANRSDSKAEVFE
ncbi:hypothetical protein QG37_01949 [Candidozyma auris]|nr:hypothetical protein QG37_01949 [[Candida] auris]